jgi:hypothetical protein
MSFNFNPDEAVTIGELRELTASPNLIRAQSPRPMRISARATSSRERRNASASRFGCLAMCRTA